MNRMGKAGGLGLLAIPAAAVLLVLAPASASAVECETVATGGGSSVWESSSSDGALSEAELLGVFTPERSDAFDGYGQVEINGSGYSNPNTTGCQRKGRTLKYPGDEVIADVVVRPELYVSKKRPMGRQLVTIRNTGNSPVTVDFGWDGDLGSNGSTRVAGTSSGNALVEPNDRWAVSCEDSDADGCGDVAGEQSRDPELAHNWEKKGKKKDSADVIDLVNGDGDFDVTFEDVTIGPGKTKVFAQVVHLARTIKPARKLAKVTDRAPRFVYAGLTKAQRRALQNW